MIEIRHLRYFVAVAEEMHFGRAAERLHMAQSPLSHQIRQLERRLGVVLLDRDHHVIGITDAGQTFLEEARRLLGELDRAVERTRRAGRGEVGRVRVGYVSEMTADVLPRSLKAHRQRFPDITIDLWQGMTGDLLEGLRAQRLDVGFVRSPGALDDLEYEELVREELYVAGPEGSWPAEPIVDLTTLAVPVAVVPAAQTSRGLRQDIDQAYSSARVDPPARREATSPTAMLLLVAAGAGTALVPASVASSFPLPGVEFRELTQHPTTTGGMCWRRAETSAVVANFLSATREVAAGPAGREEPLVRAGPSG